MIRCSVALLIIAAGISSVARGQTASADSIEIVTEDVTHFWEAVDRLNPQSSRADSIQAFQAYYFDRATPGLQSYISSRLKKPDGLLMALGMLPRYYASVRPNTLALVAQKERVRRAVADLQRYYPESRFPDIYFVIAGFISQGTVLNGKMILGAEMVAADSTTVVSELPPFLRDVDLSSKGLPCILVHELVHFQQDNVRDPSLLAQAITEGVADFVTKQAIGCVPTAAATYTWGEAHEQELWQLFQSEMNGRDFKKWLYNGNDAKDRPSQLGYWMGFQIAEAYYNKARDKRAAVRDLLHIKDFKQLLEQSGYSGGSK
jgi:hypothetical protein